MTSRIILDVHALQNVPPSNLNRDDTGAPKSAVYGGVTRARVSSQAWKRATRRYFAALLDPAELGVRTKRVAELLAEHITALDESIDPAQALKIAAETLQTATGSKIEPPKRQAEAAKKNGTAEPAPASSYLMFLSARQIGGLAELAVEGAGDIKEFFKNKEHKARAKQIADTQHSVDIALFGRMVADSTDINVDAAAQVAHALSVHRAEVESDYFTAVDDRNTGAEPGAGMIGTVDFNSATLYRYAAVDVDLLERNLGKGLAADKSPATPVRRAVEAFVDGFVASLPTGKINTFGNHTLPDAVIIKLRAARPISFVSAFEKPVPADESGGHMEGACTRLADYIPELERAYGDESAATWVLRIGSATAKISGLGTEVPSLNKLVESVGAAVAERLEQRG
ncbi:type I-E CRISPR-associated protein Cas7/Cse4/CasC [Streptomyces kanamyceticus]|uniref:CRISPR-associated protein n=2 Tax=Streptomyces kanamyceticus TaxID=1967 RepID=Q1EQJ5_STRKN|nr:type I-E CRISPR-associated protein Cas7/Cse4/CasC [Streptomyces kanamyceticus]QEU90556.1 type I-E CRISPR-associated protein Cas7/Cse4/CasC [Streptomyces kanamyceticus]BAE95525.1 CRISPR-associated protein [Streptomyces kanamyceticus]